MVLIGCGFLVVLGVCQAFHFHKMRTVIHAPDGNDGLNNYAEYHEA